MMLLDHDAQGATVQLNGRELLVLMTLVQEGRDSFDCANKTGEALDELISTAVMLVAQAQCRNGVNVPDAVVI
jgi:hypothetical protein